MKISAGRFTDPARNGLYASLATAVSVYVFAYSTRYGAVSILIFYAVWLPVLILPTRALLRAPWRLVPFLILPVVALASTLWSDRPDTTLRAAIQWGSTVALGLVAARVTSVRSMARGLLGGGVAVLAYSTANGSFAYDVVDGTYAFAGAFSSKNQLGLFASLTLLAALLPLAEPRRGGAGWALAAVPIAAFAAVTLWRTESATSMLTVGLALAVIGAGLVLVRLPGAVRTVAVALAGLALVAGIVAAVRFGALDVVFSAFGKDQTLTGRTYLWNRGIAFAEARPGLGLGYYAFWTPGRAEAEELWEEFHIAARTGFHFHNTLIEGHVGLGLFGVALLGLWGMMLLVLPLVAMLRQQRGATAVLAGFALLFLVRGLVEIDFLTPYTAGSFLVPSILLRMLDLSAENRVRGISAPQHGTGRRARDFPTGYRAARIGP